MKTNTPFRIALLLTFLTGLLALPASSFAQQQSENQSNGKKTITIHITKEVDGNVVVIDTTVITDGDFDADAFLEEKGMLNDLDMDGLRMEQDIVLRHPEMNEFRWNEEDGNFNDTLFIEDNEDFNFNGNNDMSVPFDAPSLNYEFFNSMPNMMQHLEGPQLEAMLQRVLRSAGLDEVMPLGEMKQLVVKKKRHGKKVIITFRERDEDDMEKRMEKDERVIIRNGDMGNAPLKEERIIIKHHDGDDAAMEKDAVKSSPVKKVKKMVVIKEEKHK